MRCTSILFAAACAAIAGMPGSGHAQSPAHWQARQLKASQESEAIMRDADKRNGLLAQFQVMRYASVGNNDPAFQVIFSQYLSWYQTFIGDYPDAATSFSIRQGALPDDRPSPLDDGVHHAESALTAIARLAKGRRAVFFNEAHNIPLTRSLTVQMLAQLRAEGYDYFAAETVYQTDKGLQARGYPTKDSGFYTQEPVCAEMVRTALRLGYKVVGYEALSDASGDAREAEQARNLYRQVFKDHPDARVVVNAGYAHIQESGAYLGGASMAQHLRRLIDIDPLTVEQTMLYDHPDVGGNHPYYEPVMKKLQPAGPIVFVDKAGAPWSLRPGYDVSVWFPPTSMRRGRPTWLALGGERKPYYVDGERCNQHFPCMVEARYASEGNDAIPADRVVLDPVPLNAVPSDRVRSGGAAPASELYLRPGKYRVVYSDENNATLFSQNVTIRDRNPRPPSSQPPAATAGPMSTPVRGDVAQPSVDQGN